MDNAISTDKKSIKYLRDARRFIAKGWTSGAAARDQEGNIVSPKDDDAACWCVWGALIACGMSIHYDTRGICRLLGIPVVNARSLMLYNDAQQTVDPILLLIDSAIDEYSKKVVASQNRTERASQNRTERASQNL